MGWLVVVAIIAIAGYERAAFADPADARKLGVMLDAGVPDGFNGALVYRPGHMLRLHAGGGHNLISSGVRAGFGVLLFSSRFTPSINFEVGRYARGDAQQIVDVFTDEEELTIAALQSVGYSYTNVHLGLEMGAYRMTFYVHVGASMIRTTIRDANETLAGQLDDEMDEDPPTVEFRQDPIIRAVTLSARTGLILYF